MRSECPETVETPRSEARTGTSGVVQFAVRRDDPRRRKRGFGSCPPFKTRRATVAVSYSLSDLGPLTSGLPRR